MNSLNSMSAAILSAVLNSFWLTTAATVTVWLALRYARLSAAARHRVWWVWLAILVVLPAVPPALRAWKDGQAPVRVVSEAAAPIEAAQPVTVDPPFGSIVTSTSSASKSLCWYRPVNRCNR